MDLETVDSGTLTKNRAISLREAARLQTFPDDYEFVHPDDPHFIATISRFIGNAVPVELARVIARSIKRHLKIYTSKSKG